MPSSKSKRCFTDAARAAALAARRAKAAEPDDFGIPRLFVVRNGAHAFTWEMRRFGGVLIERGTASFDSFDAARAAGDGALAALRASDLPMLKRQNIKHSAYRDDEQPSG